MENQLNQPLTKREKRFLEQKKREEEAERAISRKKTKKIIIFGLLGLLVIGGAILGLKGYFQKIPAASTASSAQGSPKIEISPLEYDFGDISIAKGTVKHDYEIKNTGSGDLKIDNIWTSCHCTTAVLKVGDKESPVFGMDGHSFGWSQKIAPGEKGRLEVIFDPAFHGPQGIGAAVREIYLSTNDSQNERASVRLIANVTP